MNELYNPEIAYRLTQMRDPANIHLSCGICNNLLMPLHSSDFTTSGQWLDAAFEKLRLDAVYPVPYPDCSKTADEGYDSDTSKWHGKYGSNRLYLLELLIALAGGWEPSENFRVQWPHPPYKGI